MEKLFQIRYKVSLANGKSYYSVKCPFCNKLTHMQIWSAKTTGKKCKCGAVLRIDRFNNGYAIKKHKGVINHEKTNS